MAEDLNSGPPNFKYNALTARSRYLLTNSKQSSRFKSPLFLFLALAFLKKHLEGLCRIFLMMIISAFSIIFLSFNLSVWVAVSVIKSQIACSLYMYR